jgi:DNA invertase Pin-like site-specific DNA recombinase
VAGVRKPRAVGYVRVSTDLQAENGHGLAVQERACRTWAKRSGYRLVALLKDEGVSGTIPAEHRPALAEALQMVSDSHAEALVVPSLDRLARTLTIQEAALAHAWQAGARVFAVDAGEVLRDDPEDPMRTAMRQMAGVFAQLERAMIAARMRRGRREKASKGGYAGYGSPPYGFRAEGGELVPDPTEQEALKLVKKLHRRGRSLREIGRALTEAGYEPRRADTWSAEMVRRLVARL